MSFDAGPAQLLRLYPLSKTGEPVALEGKQVALPSVKRGAIPGAGEATRNSCSKESKNNQQSSDCDGTNNHNSCGSWQFSRYLHWLPLAEDIRELFADAATAWLKRDVHFFLDTSYRLAAVALFLLRG